MNKGRKVLLLVALFIISALLLSSFPALAGDNHRHAKSLAEARQSLEPQLRGMPGFVGIAHSKERGEIVVFLENEQAQRLVASRFKGYTVRTEVTGRIEALSTQVAEPMTDAGPYRQDEVRPLVGGTSVSAYVADQNSAGTLGMVTYDDKILSNAHVIAMSGDGFLPTGTPIIQPGSLDGGGPGNRVGELQTYVPINFEVGAQNYVDAAIGTIDGGVAASPGEQFDDAGNYWVEGWTTVSEGDTVRKSGRTTDVTGNEVYLTNASVTVDFEGGNTAYFVDQILVYRPFSQPGDSGSAVDKDGEFVGLVFAGNDDYSFVCKAEHIIAALGIAVEPVETDQPDITVSPADFDVTLPADTVEHYTLTIGNTGEADLTYDVSDQGCPWLDVTPDSGSLAPGGSDELTVTIDTSGLAPGGYSAEIVITNNDPDRNPTIVPVTVLVSDGEPTVTTQAASAIDTTSATLNMDYTLGDDTSVDVRFAYRKAADDDWTGTPWVSRSAAGTYSRTITNLDPNTIYEFRADLKHDSTEIQGSILQFSTHAQATDPQPCAFSGKVTLDGEPTPGSIVTVELVDGTPVATDPDDVVVNSDSEYFMAIPQDVDTGQPAQAAALNFFVDGIFGGSDTWESGGYKTLDIAASSDLLPDQPGPEEGLASIADHLRIVYVWRPATQSYDMYWPEAGIDDIGTLEVGTAYWILVESHCTLEYGTRSWELFAGWNNIAWLPQ